MWNGGAAQSTGAAPRMAAAAIRHSRLAVRVVSYNIDKTEQDLKSATSFNKNWPDVLDELKHLVFDCKAQIVAICEFGSHEYGLSRSFGWNKIKTDLEDAVGSSMHIEIHASYLLLVDNRFRCRAKAVVLHKMNVKENWRKALVFSVVVPPEVLVSPLKRDKEWEIVGAVLHTVSGSGHRKATAAIKEQNILQAIAQIVNLQESSSRSVDFSWLLLGDFNTNRDTLSGILPNIQPSAMERADAIFEEKALYWRKHEVEREYDRRWRDYPDVAMSCFAKAIRISSRPPSPFAVGRDYRDLENGRGISASHNAIFFDVSPAAAKSPALLPPQRPVPVPEFVAGAASSSGFGLKSCPKAKPPTPPTTPRGPNNALFPRENVILCELSKTLLEFNDKPKDENNDGARQSVEDQVAKAEKEAQMSILLKFFSQSSWQSDELVVESRDVIEGRTAAVLAIRDGYLVAQHLPTDGNMILSRLQVQHMLDIMKNQYENTPEQSEYIARDELKDLRKKKGQKNLTHQRKRGRFNLHLKRLYHHPSVAKVLLQTGTINAELLELADEDAKDCDRRRIEPNLQLRDAAWVARKNFRLGKSLAKDRYNSQHPLVLAFKSGELANRANAATRAWGHGFLIGIRVDIGGLPESRNSRIVERYVARRPGAHDDAGSSQDHVHHVCPSKRRWTQ